MGLFHIIKDLDSSISWSRIVLRGITPEYRSITPVEFLKGNANRVASLADTNGFKHTSTAQLLQHIVAIEVRWRELIVGLDATDVSRRRLPQSHDERGELGAELVR